jgi:non-heme chloroperoxidase
LPGRASTNVLTVLDSLKLVHPVLAGHSIAGEELSSIGSRHPEKVTGLVYLDAAYGYAFNDGSQAEASPPTLPPGTPPAVAAIQAGIQKYTDIKASSLAIYAVPNGEGNDAARIREGQMKAFEKGVPSSHIVRLPGANHYVFISNDADVLKEMRGFIGSLKKQ